jgi:WD40 repeat protein
VFAGTATWAVFSGDALLVGDSWRIEEFDAGTGFQVNHLNLTTELREVAASPDGRFFAATSTGERLILWKRSEPWDRARFLDVGAEPLAVRFSPDSTQLAVCLDAREVRLLDPADGRLIRKLPLAEACTAIAFDRTGKRLAAGMLRQGVRVFDLAQGSIIVSLPHDDVRAAAFSDDGFVLATAAPDRTLRVWDLAQRRETSALDDFPSSQFGFSLDGRFVVGAGTGFGTAGPWYLRPEDLIKDACRFLMRNLSPAERQEYVPESKLPPPCTIREEVIDKTAR